MRSILATMRAAFAEAASNKRALIFQISVMIFNDLIWIAFWVLFTRVAGNVRGWDRNRILLLQATLTTVGGIVLGILNNARHIGALAVDGRLDATLSLPVRPLSHLLVRRVDPTFLGDTIFGVALFAIVGHPTPTRIAIYLGVLVASITVLTSFLVLAGSLAFFTGRGESGDLGFHSILLMANYPLDLFGGATKVIVFTVIPAAFVATVPSKLIDNFNGPSALRLLGVAAFFALAASTIFRLGLRRYSSGSVWSRA
jgi:ABC-2 type transport system permease protein